MFLKCTTPGELSLRGRLGLTHTRTIHVEPLSPCTTPAEPTGRPAEVRAPGACAAPTPHTQRKPSKGNGDPAEPKSSELKIVFKVDTQHGPTV